LHIRMSGFSKRRTLARLISANSVKERVLHREKKIEELNS
jgi:hypothetical protein